MSTDLYLVKPDDPISQAQTLFQMYSIHHLPVLKENGEIAGIVTPFDLLAYAFQEKRPLSIPK